MVSGTGVLSLHGKAGVCLLPGELGKVKECPGRETMAFCMRSGKDLLQIRWGKSRERGQHMTVSEGGGGKFCITRSECR